MEIIFDENKNDTFHGKIYPILNLQTFDNINFKDIQLRAEELIEANHNNKIILIRPDQENNYFLLFAALLGSDDTEFRPGQVIFKVKNCKETLEKYKPFLSFSIAANYVCRLLKMNKKEIYKDIQSLGYLNIKVKTSYQENIITLHLPNPGKKYIFIAENMENTIILASFIKMMSLIKVNFNIDIKIILKKIPTDNNNSTKLDQKKILQKLYWCAKPFLGNN